MNSYDSCAVKSLIDHEQIALRIMGWLSKIFKGSSHKISERHYNDRYGEETTSYAPSPSGVNKLITTCNFSSLRQFQIWHSLGSYI